MEMIRKRLVFTPDTSELFRLTVIQDAHDWPSMVIQVTIIILGTEC